MGVNTSRLRQQLRRIAEQYVELAQSLLGEQGPLVRGSFGTRRRKCGGQNCRCTRGELHESKFLSASDGEKVRQVHVPARDEVDVAAGVKRYRRFHQSRKRLATLARRHLELVDELSRSLLKPYPPDNPLPPAQRRGRKPRRDAG